MRILFGIFFITPLFLSSCATSLENPYLSQATDSSLDANSLGPLLKANLGRWTHRDQPDSLRAFIESQRLILKSPNRKEKDFILMARACFIMGDYFSDTTADRISFFGEAANWGEMALLQNPEYAKTLKGPRPEKALTTLRKRNMEGLYWHALALSRWADLKGVGTALRYSSRIQNMMERVRQLTPDYFFGGPHRYFGGRFGRLPGLNEDELAQSRKHFEKALQAGPHFFENHVSFAEIYGKKIENRVLIKKHLEIAVRGNAGQLPEFKPEQTLEQRRAIKLLKGESL